MRVHANVQRHPLRAPVNVRVCQHAKREAARSPYRLGREYRRRSFDGLLDETRSAPSRPNSSSVGSDK